MGMSWDIVIIGIVCTCIGLLAGWRIYHGKVGLLRMEIKVLRRELSDERARGEAYGKAADEWKVAAMRADAEIDLNYELKLDALRDRDRIRHHKYKRCLNNAWWCQKSSNAYAWSASNHRGWKIAEYYDKKAELYRKWQKRWLALAEKVREAK